MKGIVGVGAGAAIALLLAGCNMVVSDEPMLVARPDAPVLKPGIWVDNDSDDDCDYEIASVPESWPDCASPAIVTADGQFLTFDEEEGEWRGMEIVLASGEPTIVQVRLPEDLTRGAVFAPPYVYLALDPVQTDTEGRITEIATWIIYCGPVDEAAEGAMEDPAALVTDRPFAGLTVSRGNCAARDLAALRNAAKLSRAMQEGGEGGGAHWLRPVSEGMPD